MSDRARQLDLVIDGTLEPGSLEDDRLAQLGDIALSLADAAHSLPDSPRERALRRHVLTEIATPAASAARVGVRRRRRTLWRTLWRTHRVGVVSAALVLLVGSTVAVAHTDSSAGDLARRAIRTAHAHVPIVPPPPKAPAPKPKPPKVAVAKGVDHVATVARKQAGITESGAPTHPTARHHRTVDAKRARMRMMRERMRQRMLERMRDDGMMDGYGDGGPRDGIRPPGMPPDEGANRPLGPRDRGDYDPNPGGGGTTMPGQQPGAPPPGDAPPPGGGSMPPPGGDGTAPPPGDAPPPGGYLPPPG